MKYRKRTTYQPAPTFEGARQVPSWISHADWFAAISPVAEALGIDPNNIYARGFKVTSTEIEFYSAEAFADVEPVALHEGDEEVGVWAWPVRVRVAAPWVDWEAEAS